MLLPRLLVVATGECLFELCQSLSELCSCVPLFLDLNHELLSVSLNLEQILLVLRVGHRRDLFKDLDLK